MLKKFHWPSLYSRNLWEKIFFSENFSTNQNSGKNEIRFFDFFLIGIERSVNSDAEKILLAFVVFSKSAGKIFFYQIFSTNQNSGKNQIQFFDFFVIGIERSVNCDAEKILLTFVVFSKSARKIFFSEIFSTNHISRKNQIPFFYFFVIGIERSVNCDAEKILLTFVVFSKSARKIFFSQIFSTNQNSRKKQIQFFYFFVIEIERLANTDAEKIPLAFVVFSKSVRKNFFFWKFFNQSEFGKKWNSILRFFPHWNREISEQWCWKNSIGLCCILQIRGKNFFLSNFFNQSEFGKKSNSILRFFCHWNREISELWCWKNSIDLCCILQIREKNFFFWNFFNQSYFEKKSNSILLFFCHWNREISELWCWKNSIDLCCILQIREKNFFFSNFFNQSEFEKKTNSILLFFCHWNRKTSEHWCWKNSIGLRCILEICEKKFFFLKIFQPIRIREKMKFDSSIFSSLESRDQWTVMLKKFYWPLFYSPNPREKFFFIKFFQPIRIREKIKFNSSIFLSLESRDQWTVMLKKFYWPLLYSPNPREKFFFLKFFQPIIFREKIKFHSSIFLSLESRDQWTVMLKKFYWPLLYSPNPREKFFFLKFFQPIRIREKIKFNSSIFLSLKSKD